MKSQLITGVIAGNFDVIHPGYIDMFAQCKEHCSCLIVLLHEDPTKERPEKCKPVLSIVDRMRVLNGLRDAMPEMPKRVPNSYASLKRLSSFSSFCNPPFSEAAFLLEMIKSCAS